MPLRPKPRRPVNERPPYKRAAARAAYLLDLAWREVANEPAAVRDLVGFDVPQRTTPVRYDVAVGAFAVGVTPGVSWDATRQRFTEAGGAAGGAAGQQSLLTLGAGPLEAVEGARRILRIARRPERLRRHEDAVDALAVLLPLVGPLLQVIPLKN